jgi:pimeloyl-ACP methyl ester carboxylesterase
LERHKEMQQISTNVRAFTGSAAVPSINIQQATSKQPLAWLARLSALSPDFAARFSFHFFTQPKRYPRPERERQWLQNAEEFTLSNGIRAWSWGEGPLCLLVHGWQGRGAQLGALIDPLVQRGYRVVTFDVEGHGSSPGTHSTLLSWLRPIFDVVERYGDPVTVIAHSFGCPAVSLALRRGLTPRSVVYLAPPDALDLGARTFARVTGIGDSGFEALARRITAATGLTFEGERVSAFGPTMTSPLLLVHDEHDADVNIRCARTYARYWPGCQVHTTSGLGHRKILYDADVIGRVVRYVHAHRYAATTLERSLQGLA